MIEFQDFASQFVFRPEYDMLVGVERESFLVREGIIVPIAPEVLSVLPENGAYGYELSACQLEDRVGPIPIGDLIGALRGNDAKIVEVERSMGFTRSTYEVGPENMPLEVYPDPKGRYQKITKDMPSDILLAACRVIATHVHVGMPDLDTALRVYNHVRGNWEDLSRMGDGSSGERLAIYPKMAPDFVPPHYSSLDDFYIEAVERGFAEKPRQCYHLIRISVHGTIEFRMFGTTREVERVATWARRCHDLCSLARGCA